ncbi:thiamine pyrophosphate-binding protein [Loktanella sp. M215]|uniref:thiamine pyrophosphate-binding protein n=1 Tax=Loktanella sp. M215 TaxID=2675431 RepID=UPI001F025FDD|nr:thiamine pyrophosphate-binding protein [Loktanella sp. M215]MCF7702068.1 thiamine pyrophosphate-binding protein [Loktanella sp. M215]
MQDDIDRPAPSETETLYGSDALAVMMRKLEVPYVALNPGSSFRGLHDSLVNYLGNREPQMLLCLHEEHAVSIAHGWAKVKETPLAVILHANVGLMHAAMALYNAWCDRVPMLVFGATGPVDAAKRRPWIDWLHTSRDQAAIVRPYIKWDDQPASLAASLTSMMRAARLTATAPMAPTYVCFDVTVQEQKIDALPQFPDPDRHVLPRLPSVGPNDVAELYDMLARAIAPVFLMGRVSRDRAAWDRRIALAEQFGARVVTDIKTAAAFPTRHPLHAGTPGYFLSPDAGKVIAAADLVVCFDWVDPAGSLSQAGLGTETTVVNVTLEPLLQNGWSLDHQAFVSSDLSLLAAPDAVVAALCEVAGIGEVGSALAYAPIARTEITGDTDRLLLLNELSDLVADAVADKDVTYMRLPLGWDGAKCDFRDPMDYLGYDGGAGIGSGPGMAVGAALALAGAGRIPVAVLGDGDFIMGATALWTATHHNVPLLIVVANNRSYFNDEIHQERVAKDRKRLVANKHVGQAIDNPDVDIAGLARAQGAVGFGPVSEVDDVTRTLCEAVKLVKAGKTVVVDVRVMRGYSEAMSDGMTQD